MLVSHSLKFGGVYTRCGVFNFMGICLWYARSNMPYVIKMAKTHMKLQENKQNPIFSPFFMASFGKNGLKCGFHQVKSLGNLQLFMSLEGF
jgi:hypothetical protein